jgi:glycosyltransferase involved in cell wall biosynthesis
MRFTIPILGLTPHGGTRVLVEIANALVRRGFAVTVVAPNRPISMPYVLDPRVGVKLVGPALENKLLIWAAFLLMVPFHLARSTIIANHFLTVVPAWAASKLMGANYVFFVQGIEYKVYRGRLYRALKAVCEWTYRQGNVVAANSYLGGELGQYGPVLLTLKLGVSKPFFAIARDVGPKHFDVIYFLRSDGYKRIDRFDKMLGQMDQRGIRVLCVSQDAALLEAYSARVATFCPKDDSELIGALDRARLLLLTSDHEGFALPPLEAMARGLPAVMFECGGPGAYATHGTNCLVVSDNTAETAVEYITTLLNDSEAYNRMSAAGTATALQFQLDDAVGVLVDYLGSGKAE